MIDWSTCSAVQSHPQIVGGAWVFHGTRIPITALFENLEDGADIGNFLNWFPGVKQEQVKRVLDHAADSARASAQVLVLFDQGTPVPLMQELPFDVSTVFELGWATLENGELLTEAEDKGFDILLTTDKNLKYQQNLSNRSIGIIVLSTTSWPRIKNVAHEIETAIRRIDIGGFVEIHIP